MQPAMTGMPGRVGGSNDGLYLARIALRFPFGLGRMEPALSFPTFDGLVGQDQPKDGPNSTNSPEFCRHQSPRG